MTSRRPGPRADRADVRGDILTAARELFARKGFQGTTLRAVAAAAGVDVALVPYYFGNKQGLFTASLELPVDPRAKIDEVFAGGSDGLGERLIRTLDGLFQDPVVGPAIIGLMREAIGDGDTGLRRDFIVNVVLVAYTRHIQLPDAAARAALAASQLVGIGLARYVIRVEPLAGMSTEELARYAGPTLQRYLVDPIP